MGAINYGTNNILCTIGCMNDSSDFVESEMGYFMEEEGLEEEKARERAYENYYVIQNDDFTSINRLIEKETFNFYEVKLEAGYYEGYYLSIDDKYNYLDNYQEKLEMQKELTKLSNLMKEMIEDYGMRVCYPWWCTSWEETIEKSLNVLAEAVKVERDRIKHLKTDFIVFNRLSKEERKKLIGW